VITLKIDLEFWPTYELRQSDGVWERVGQLDSREVDAEGKVDLALRPMPIVADRSD